MKKEYVNVNLSLEESDYKKLKTMSEKRDVSTSFIMREALKMYISEKEGVEKVEEIPPISEDVQNNVQKIPDVQATQTPLKNDESVSTTNVGTDNIPNSDIVQPTYSDKVYSTSEKISVFPRGMNIHSVVLARRNKRLKRPYDETLEPFFHLIE